MNHRRCRIRYIPSLQSILEATSSDRSNNNIPNSPSPSPSPPPSPPVAWVSVRHLSTISPSYKTKEDWFSIDHAHDGIALHLTVLETMTNPPGISHGAASVSYDPPRDKESST